jgi:acyl transferase domain-containing protein
VNSFGFGGSNAHVVLDAVSTNQNPVSERPHRAVDGESNGLSSTTNNHLGADNANEQPLFCPRLLFYSASDDKGPERQAKLDSQYFLGMIEAPRMKLIDNFCYTRNCRRSLLPWKSYAIINGATDLKNLTTRLCQPIRSSSRTLNLGFVFTGQGAQWCGMGKELFQYPAFKQSISRSDEYLRNLGCDWQLAGNK